MELSIDEKDLSYIAGFFDGEGCITLNGNYLGLTVSASNTVLKPLEFMQKTLGGRILARTGLKKKFPQHKLSFDWRIYGPKAASVLALLLPYLKVKREQAMLGIELVLAKPNDRVDIAVKIRVLNKGGDLRYLN